MKKTINLFLLALLLIPIVFTSQGVAAEDPDNEYYRVRTITLDDGASIDEVIINGPPTPPPGYDPTPVELPDPKSPEAIVVLSNVPAFDWSFGCSATSAAMIAGYYDRTGYPNMYTGPTSSGVMPMDNSSWPDVVINGENRHQCPLSATRDTVDGRTTYGHVDDYWITYTHPGPDPFIGNWTEHTYGDCTGDYMKTNQSNYSNSDGSTRFWNYTSGNPFYWYQMEAGGQDADDGGYGVKLFYESRGYTVTQMYNQYILGQGSNPLLGFTYDQYKAEIDAGRPVMIHVVGHTMVGLGYDDSSNLMYIHDTWNYNLHTMTWGGSYSGMQHRGVTIVQLDTPPSGQAVINEIMPDPSAVADANGEWFEVVNPTGSAIDINGWCISTTGTISHTISNGSPLNVPAHGYLVLGNNSNSGTNGGVTVDYQYSGITLGDTAGTVVLENNFCGGGGTEVDRVDYSSATFPLSSGRSIEFCYGSQDNNDGSYWLDAEQAWTGSAGDYGSPVSQNDCLELGVPTAITLRNLVTEPTAPFAGPGLALALAAVLLTLATVAVSRRGRHS